MSTGNQSSNVISSSSTVPNGTKIEELPVVIIDVEKDDIEVPSFPKPRERESTAMSISPIGIFGVGNRNGSSSKSVAPTFQPPEFNEIIAGKRLTPFSRQDFRSFLVKRSIEELLDYYLNVVEFRSKFNRDVQNKIVEIKDVEKEAYVVTNCLAAHVKDPIEIGKAIANEFIREGAKKEINISATQRQEIMRYFFPEEYENINDNRSAETLSYVTSVGEDDQHQQQKDEANPVSIFDDSFIEVEQLLQMNAYEEFLKVVSTMNISDHESWIRMKRSITSMVLVALTLSIIIWAESVGRIRTRWFRLLIFPMLFVTFAGMEAYRSKLCIVCAHFNTTTVNSESESVDGKKKDIVKQVYDLFAKEALTKRARFVTFRVFICMLFITGIALALPPYTTL